LTHKSRKTKLQDSAQNALVLHLSHLSQVFIHYELRTLSVSKCMMLLLTSDYKKFLPFSKRKLCKDKWKRLYMHCTTIYRQHQREKKPQKNPKRTT